MVLEQGGGQHVDLAFDRAVFGREHTTEAAAQDASHHLEGLARDRPSPTAVPAPHPTVVEVDRFERSFGAARDAAVEMGLEPVAHIAEGFDGWKEAGGPVDLPEEQSGEKDETS